MLETAYSPIVSPGNGSATAIPVTWPFFTGSLKVTRISSSGVETVLSIGTHYTVSGGTDGSGLPGVGTVNLVTAHAVGESIRVERSTPRTQRNAFAAIDPFPPKVIEAALDKLTLIVQEGGSGGGAGLGFSGEPLVLDSAGPVDVWNAKSVPIRYVPAPVDDTDAVNKLYADAQRDAVVTFANQAAADAAAATSAAGAAAGSVAQSLSLAQQQAANYVLPNNTTTFTHVQLDNIAAGFNGSAMTFNLTLASVAFTPESAAGLIVHVNGVYQSPATDYSVNGTQIVFTDPHPAGTTCTILAMRTAIAIVNLTPTAFMTTLIQTANTAAAARTQLGAGATGDALFTAANSGAARTTLGTRTSSLDSIAASFNGVLTTFNLTVSAAAFTPRDAFGIGCIYNGVAQIPGDAFTVSGSTITFTFTPQAGDTCFLWAIST